MKLVEKNLDESSCGECGKKFDASYVEVHDHFGRAGLNVVKLCRTCLTKAFLLLGEKNAKLAYASSDFSTDDAVGAGGNKGRKKTKA